jgi:hypothetical protein
MKFLPIENIVYKTNLTEEEAMQRLSNSVEPESWRYTGIRKPYEGKIIEQEFKIYKFMRIRFLEVALPVITGIITNDFDGLTTIKVKMQLHIPSILFLCIFCGGMGFASLAGLFKLSSIDTFLWFGMLFFYYIIMILFFNFESLQSKKDLKKIFQAEIVKE